MISLWQFIYSNYELVSPSCPPGVKHPSEMDMTNGCGLINYQAIHSLYERLGFWKEIPVAIQCRLAGAKVSVLLFSIHEKVTNFFFRDCCYYILERMRIAGSTPVCG